MKIDEFIKDVNRIKIKELKAYHHLNSIWVTYQSRTLLQVPFDAKTVFDCLIDNELNDLDVDIELQLNDKLNRFLQTPINERFPEKKYRLRWIDNKDGTSKYIDRGSNGDWDMWGDKNSIKTFNESEIEQLKKDYPCFASVIDIMKEPVEEEE